MSNSKSSVAQSVRVYLRLLSYVRVYWLTFLVSILGYVLFALSQPAFAKLIEYFVTALNAPRGNYLYWVPAGAVVIAVFRGLGSFVGSYYLAKVSNHVVHDLRVAMFDRLLDLPNTYFDHNNSGHLMSRITYNVSLVTTAATNAIRTVIREGLTVVFLLAFLLWTEWRLTLVFLCIAPVIGLIVSRVGKRLRRLSHNIQGAMGDITHIASETIHNYPVMRSFGGQDYEHERFMQASRYNFKQSMKMVQASAINTPVLQCIVTVAMALVMFMVLYLKDGSNTAMLIAFITAAGMLPKPIRQLSEVYGDVQKGIAAAESVFEHLDTPIEPNLGTYQGKDSDGGRAQGRLAFEGVYFRYSNTDEDVLQNIDFCAEPGTTVALVGHSGSGKTTLTQLISRFYGYHQGAIRIDGVPIVEFELRYLRRQIALVSQQTTLFNDTIANNIAYGDLQGASEAQIIEAARAANAMGFIEQLPEGIQTLVGENGVLLSGGQRQRLAIARALLKDAPILILDEATSALDTESERLIQEALQAVMKNRTTLVVAHRLSTIENADMILVMDGGCIVEQGSHAQLLVHDGYYARLHRMQFRDLAQMNTMQGAV